MAEGKKRINSKQKGSEYERKVAKILGAWFQEDFNRVPASGGLRWGDDNRVAGDIAAPVDSLFPFTVECKKRNEWDLDQVLKGTGDVESWWKQSVGDSIRVNTIPFLVFAKNFSPNYIMIEQSVFDKILAHKDTKEVPFNYFNVNRPDMPARVICVLEHFLGFVPKEDIIGALVNEK